MIDFWSYKGDGEVDNSNTGVPQEEHPKGGLGCGSLILDVTISGNAKLIFHQSWLVKDNTAFRVSFFFFVSSIKTIYLCWRRQKYMHSERQTLLFLANLFRPGPYAWSFRGTHLLHLMVQYSWTLLLLFEKFELIKKRKKKV